MIICLWLSSALLPLVRLLPNMRPTLERINPQASIEWLALPAMWSQVEDAVDLWKAFGDKKEGIVIAQESANELEHNLAEGEGKTSICDSPFHIRLYGHIWEGVTPVYCFLDTENDRWFRLQIGQLDEVSGMELSVGKMDKRLYLRDLRSGRRFRIESEEWELSPVSPEEGVLK